VPLHYLPNFHLGIANLCKRLRYLLGGIRPRQTTRQILFPVRLHGQGLELKAHQGGISLATVPVPKLKPAFGLVPNRNCGGDETQRLLQRLHGDALPPILNRHTPNSISSCSKASRGLFVQLWLTSIFTRLAISPSPSLRQYPSCYAIRAGRNFIKFSNFDLRFSN